MTCRAGSENGPALQVLAAHGGPQWVEAGGGVSGQTLAQRLQPIGMGSQRGGG
jgi:hypothetical protein